MHRYSILAIALLFAATSLWGLSRSRPAEASEPIAFSTKHLPFKKWNRDDSCCSAQGKQFAVASAGPKSAEAAQKIYREGCNLVEAAIAATFVTAVERPQSTGIGGGGFLTLRLKNKSGEKTQFIDFRETAPQKAKPDMFFKDGKKIENLSRDGVHAVATPGFVAGMFDTFVAYGSKKPACRWEKLIAPAIALAEAGFPVYPSLAERIEIRKAVLAKDPIAAAMYLPGGVPLKVGEVLVQKDLAQTLRQIAKTGKNDFYRGTLAKKIADFIRDEALPEVAHVTQTDLAEYRVKFEQPLEGKFRGYRVLTAPPPSAGGVILLEALNVLDPMELGNVPTTQTLHLLSEILLRGFADRSLIGDGDQNYRRLLTPAYAKAMRESLNLERATAARDLKPLHVDFEEKPHTSHVSLLDADGNAVGITTTVNFFFGSGRVVPGTGIFLNDEMDDFGAAVLPGKRPVSSMMPTILLKDDRPTLVIGAAGSSTIVSAVLQGILNDTVWWPHDVRRAVFAGRLHKQYDPANDILSLEPGAFSESVEKDLAQRGHNLQPAKFSAQMQAVGFNPEGGKLTAVHEPRDAGGALAQ